MFKKLTSGTLPPPKKIADTLAPAVAERRLVLHSFHPDEQALFERSRHRRCPAAGRRRLPVRARSNRGQNKIDSFMRRTVVDDVTVDPRTQHRARHRHGDRLQRRAGVRTSPTVIGNHRGKQTGNELVDDCRVDAVEARRRQASRATSFRAARRRSTDARRTRRLSMYRRERTTVKFDLEGTLDVHDGYRLEVVPQPLVNPDHLDVHVHAAPVGRSTAVGHRLLICANRQSFSHRSHIDDSLTRHPSPHFVQTSTSTVGSWTAGAHIGNTYRGPARWERFVRGVHRSMMRRVILIASLITATFFVFAGPARAADYAAARVTASNTTVAPGDTVTISGTNAKAKGTVTASVNGTQHRVRHGRRDRRLQLHRDGAGWCLRRRLGRRWHAETRPWSPP